jgi:hypothetical protein
MILFFILLTEKQTTEKASYIDPFIFGTTFWQTLFTNWWYNVGRDFYNNPFETSKYWFNLNIENLELFNTMFNNMINKK